MTRVRGAAPTMPRVLRGASRLPFAFGVTLAVPAVALGAWAWLRFGGAIDDALARERASAERALGVAVTALEEGLRAATSDSGCALDLDAAGRVVGPFAQTADAGEPVPGTAERAAFARLAAGTEDEALAFFAHAAESALSPEGWLAFARLRGERDPDLGAATLADARARFATVRCGPVPCPLLAAIVESRWPPDLAASRDDELLAALRDVPAGAVATVASALAAVRPALRDDPRLDALRAAAAAFDALHGTAAPRASRPGPHGTVLVAAGEGAVHVLAAAAVRAACDEARTRARAAEPDFVVDAATEGEPTAGRVIPALGATWFARPARRLASAQLETIGDLALAAALAAFLLGNLAVAWLGRRQAALTRMRSEFVDAVSHELRTPLAALSLKAEMLARGDVPPERVAHYLRGLHDDCRRLDLQVQRVLDFARLERGGPLRPAIVPARSLLAHSVRAGLPALRLVRQRVEVDAPRALPAVRGDLTVLTLALRNLLENAARYAPAGSTVEVRARADGDGLVVEVADRGPGIADGEHEAIFAPFVRGSASRAHATGSGLGLALVAAATRAHHGRVEVAPRADGGTVFRLRLPAVPGEEAQAS
ncbi:MAG TPA: HAMP domain-containing sensor histidine kinase [Planctomycetota bacterium]|nr:HAMP domain-containing sensor histidine kinase [Planctomycetota bacterium]